MRTIGHAVEACISPHAWLRVPTRGERRQTVIIASPTKRGRGGVSAVIIGPDGVSDAIGGKDTVIAAAEASLRSGHPVYIEVRGGTRWARVILIDDEPFAATIEAPTPRPEALVLLESRPITRRRLREALRPCG